jgi:hypothetical protein
MNDENEQFDGGPFAIGVIAVIVVAAIVLWVIPLIMIGEITTK